MPRRLTFARTQDDQAAAGEPLEVPMAAAAGTPERRRQRRDTDADQRLTRASRPTTTVLCTGG